MRRPFVRKEGNCPHLVGFMGRSGIRYGVCVGGSGTEKYVPRRPLSQCDLELIKRANKKIADLKEDIHQLSEEFQWKDSLLSNFSSGLPRLSGMWLQSTLRIWQH